MAGADFARGFPGGGDPDGLLNAGGIGGGVGVGAPEKFQVAAARVEHGAGVGSPAELADVLAIVGGVVGEARALEIMRRRSRCCVRRAR